MDKGTGPVRLKFGARARNSHRVRRQTASRTAFQFGKHGPLAADVCVARLFGLERGATVLPPNSPAVPATPQGRRSRWSVNVAVRPLFAGPPPNDEPHGGKIIPGELWRRGRRRREVGGLGGGTEKGGRIAGTCPEDRRDGCRIAGDGESPGLRAPGRCGPASRGGTLCDGRSAGSRPAVGLSPGRRLTGARWPCAGLAARPPSRGVEPPLAATWGGVSRTVAGSRCAWLAPCAGGTEGPPRRSWRSARSAPARGMAG